VITGILQIKVLPVLQGKLFLKNGRGTGYQHRVFIIILARQAQTISFTGFPVFKSRG
jgi:hypothetical protein